VVAQDVRPIAPPAYSGRGGGVGSSLGGRESCVEGRKGLGYLLTSTDPYATDGVVARSVTLDDEQWANLLRMASEQDVFPT
jgi:hypothetical protein